MTQIKFLVRSLRQDYGESQGTLTTLENASYGGAFGLLLVVALLALKAVTGVSSLLCISHV